MKTLDGYMRGVNLGHWISQYGDKGKEHWDSYITEPDFARIAEWGLDHIRLPVDYMLFERDEHPGVFLESGLQYIDFALDCCKKHGLNMILDLHHTPGFFFGDRFNKDKNNLFTDRNQQLRFMNIWKMFADRYKNEGDNLIFELLNELVLEDTEPWNKLWPEAAAEIEKISPARRIIVGSNLWNAIEQLKNLTVVDDPNIIYNFHCYAPFLFTHQRAAWDPNMFSYQRSVTYPMHTAEHQEFFEKNDPYLLEQYDKIDIHAMEDFFKPAVEFMKTSGHPLYCGEFGVYNVADMDSTLRWHSDIISLFNKYGIGRAVWSYKGFSRITEPDGSYNKPLVEILAR